MGSWGVRSGRFVAGGTGAAVWLKLVAAHLITSCWDWGVDLSCPVPRPASAQGPAVISKVGPRGWTGGQPAADQ